MRGESKQPMTGDYIGYSDYASAACYVSAICTPNDIAGLAHLTEQHSGARVVGSGLTDRIGYLTRRHRLADVLKGLDDGVPFLGAPKIVGASETKPFTRCLIELHGDFSFRNVAAADIEQAQGGFWLAL